MKNRSKFLIGFFIILAAVIIYSLLDRMVIRREMYFKSSYTDRAFVELMEKLIKEGVFTSNGDKILINEDVLKGKGLRKSTEERVRNNLSFIYAKKGRINFDKQSASITNSRTFTDERVARGRFLDRSGFVLAWSDIDERTWKQQRKYAEGPQFYHIIGHWNPVFGKRNLERELDDYLSGKGHLPIYRKTSDPLRDIQLGDDISLTLEANVQRRAYELLGLMKGAVVVIDVKTGEVIAAVSTPSFDPGTRDNNKWREAFDDEARPVENRAFSTLYPPGSTFKTVVAAAWLERDKEQDDFKGEYTTVCTGRKNRYGISDIHVHGKENLDQAFADSCNLFFSEIGVKLGRSILDYAGKFGFNRRYNLIPQLKNPSQRAEKSTAFLWNAHSEGDRGEREFDAVDFRRNPKIVAQGAIGQNLVMATPLQMAMVAASVANKGMLLNPYIVKEIKTGDAKKVLFSAKPVEMGRVMKETTSLEIKKFMEEVMVKGTGKDVKKIYSENGRYITNNNPHFGKGGQGGFSEGKLIRVAGKTGTAEVGDRNGNGQVDPDEKPHSWFIGFAPAENPKYAIAVIAENQGFGSLTAAPIAVEVLAEAMNTKAIR